MARVGESITASAGTVILALLTLLVRQLRDLPRPRRPARHRDRRHARRRRDAAAGAAGDPRPGRVLALEDRRRRHQRKLVGQGGPARRPAARPTRSSIGLVVFGALALGVAVLLASWLRRCHRRSERKSTPPPATPRLRGTSPRRARTRPTSSSKLADPVWKDPGAVVTASQRAGGLRAVQRPAGPLDPTGTPIAPAVYVSCTHSSGTRSCSRRYPPPAHRGLRCRSALYDFYRATARFVSPDGHTIQFESGLGSRRRELDACPQRRARDPGRARHGYSTTSGAAGERRGGRGASSLRRELDLRQRPRSISSRSPIIAIGILLALVLRSLVAPLYLIASVMLVLPGGARAGLHRVHQARPQRRPDVPLTVLDVHLPLSPRRGLQHPRHDADQGGGPRPPAPRRRRDGRRQRPARRSPRPGSCSRGPSSCSPSPAGSQPGGSQIRDIGLGLALGILMDTFLVRSLLVPSTVVIARPLELVAGQASRDGSSRRAGLCGRQGPFTSRRGTDHGPDPGYYRGLGGASARPIGERSHPAILGLCSKKRRTAARRG